MASTSYAKQSTVPMKEPVMNYIQYPAPVARFEDVVANPKLFMDSLEKLHAAMGTKFMIPIIGGKELDLHRLFVEVTSRGGIEKIVRERRWKEVTAIFNFPSTATNASFVLRKYYGSLLFHYEQLYFFRARGWTPVSTASSATPPIPQVPAQVVVQPSPEYQAATIQQQRTNTAGLCGARGAPSASFPVMGVIDGKFESGYLVTVTIGSEKLKGVLYQAPHSQVAQPYHLPPHFGVSASDSVNARVVPGVQRRRRRKKSEIKRRDPAHPKPNRSGYNFFFAEQHARLKPLHPGKDREISRMIGELWTKLKENEKSVYQEKAMKDKERYRIEMEDYRERLRTGQIIRNAVPLQQWEPAKDQDTAGTDAKMGEAGDSPQTMDNESGSSEGDSEDEDDKNAYKDSDMEASPAAGISNDSGNNGMDTSADAPSIDLSKSAEHFGSEKAEKFGDADK